MKAGALSPQVICFTDLLATLAEICSVPLIDGAGPDSMSFLPTLEGKKQPVRSPIVMQAGSTDALLIRSGDWKLINQLGSGGFTKPNKLKPSPGEPEGQLYNMATDRSETTNLYAKHPEIVARLTTERNKIVAARQSRS